MNHDRHDDEKPGFFSSRVNIALLGFLAIGGYFLVTEHRAHLIPYLKYLPYLLLLACPFMHLFMHGEHGDRHDHGGGSPKNRTGEQS